MVRVDALVGPCEEGRKHLFAIGRTARVLLGVCNRLVEQKRRSAGMCVIKKHGLQELTLPVVSGIPEASNMSWGFCNLEHSNRKQTVVKCTFAELPRQRASFPLMLLSATFSHTQVCYTT